MENNFIARVHDLTGIDSEEITQKIADLDVDSMLELLGALTDGDQERVSAILSTTETIDGDNDHRTDIFSESIMGGLINLPNLARIQALAGLPVTEPTETEIEIQPSRLQPVYDGSELDLDGIIDAFERIERAVGDLLIKDAKIVRERIQRLVGRLNESSKIRKRKI